MKTEVMHQPTPRKPYVEPNISVNVQGLNLVDKFTYLGSSLSRTFVIDDEINTRLAKASAAFDRPHKNVSGRRSITTEIKIKFDKAVVLTTMLYGCDSCQEDQPLPQHQSEEPTWHKMARQDPRHRGAHPRQPSHYPYHPDGEPTSLRGPCTLYATPSAPQETPVRRIPGWQTLP